MKVIGITGPSGAGKSVCCDIFGNYGIPSIDTDQVYHRLIEKPSPCVSELVKTFGKEILNDFGGINRTALASLVFSDTTKASTNKLNQITHRFVRTETMALLDNYQKQGAMAVLVDAPLLYEARFDEMCDFCIAVVASRELRLSRVIVRDNLSAERAEMRFSAQNSDEYYTERSKYTITNNSDKENVERQVLSILETEGLIA